jgi:hypothetical protein
MASAGLQSKVMQLHESCLGGNRKNHFASHVCLSVGAASQVLTAAVTSSAFRDIILCRPLKMDRPFGGACGLKETCTKQNSARPTVVINKILC